MTPDLTALSAAVPAALVSRLREARNVLAVSHENPDADTLGGSLAVVHLVEALGGSATPVCSDPIPELYEFLPEVSRFATDPEPGRDYDLVVLSDCADLARVGAVLERHREFFAAAPLVSIDHHLSNDGGSPADWIDPESAATCEMLTLLAVRLGVPLDAAGGTLATTLMAGIVMDTATFQHPNATPRTLIVTAALVAAGAPLSDISRRLYRTKPEAQLRLFGRVLARLETALGGRLVWATLEEADLTSSGAEAAHSEGIIDLLAQAAQAEVAILFKERGSETRVSFRTRSGGVDAIELAGRFDGGGHARASGATVALPLAEARPLVLAEAARLAAAVDR